MKTVYRFNWLTAAALLLALPTAYFILISVLKYTFGIEGPFDAMRPLLEQWGVKESLGFNINLLILSGPLIAIGICLLQFVKLNMHFTKEEFDFNIQVKKHWFPIIVAAFSAGLLAILFWYVVGENCNCH
jgi:hypothetical protein